MYQYLKAFFKKMSVEDIDIKFIFGLLEGHQIGSPFEGFPHCWLELNGKIIDNSFVYSTDPGLGQRRILQMRQEKYYNKYDHIKRMN